MSAGAFVFCAFMGWCGTPWPGWWRHPSPPDPDPWWLIDRLVGAAGGVISGLLLTQVLPVGPVGDTSAVAMLLTGVAAFAGSVVVQDLYQRYLPARSAAMSAGAKH
jgi:hypothetical protein